MSTAKRFKLIPEALWNRIREGGLRENTTCKEEEEDPTKMCNSTFQVDVVQPQPDKPAVDVRIIDDLPKQCRRKARTILGYIEKSLKLDDNMRVLYPDGACGGHISDLLQWTTCSRMIADKMERPIDSDAWLKLLCSHNVPPACFKDRMQMNVTSSKKNEKIRKKNKNNEKMIWLTKVPRK